MISSEPPLRRPQPLSRRSPRARKYSTRAFFLTLLIVSALTALSLLQQRSSGLLKSASHSVLGKRDGATHTLEDLECRLVHGVEDKCAFVLANCPDEEAGMFSYLSLYYCRMKDAQPVAFMIMVLWLGLLFSTIGIAASDFFCVNLSTIANLLGMSESLAGVTFLAFGNGSPDVFSTFAAMSTNSGSLAVGELIGAAGFITAVVAGSMAIVRPFKVAKKSFVRDVSFFIIAASFSMVFLYDGKLQMWECACMVGFYLFYVVFVVSWHWALARRQRRRQTEAAIRSHYVVPGGEEAEFEEYHDDDEADTRSRTTLSRGPTLDDFSVLERGGEPTATGLEEDDEELVRERWLGELNSNMRVSRPRLGSRRNTQTPIRPSLVGALEFRAVLYSLKKSRNIQSIPINLRRYSDDPSYTTAQQQVTMANVEDPDALSPGQPSDLLRPVERSHLDPGRVTGNRFRAVSVNDIDRLSPDPSVLQRRTASSDLLGLLPEQESTSNASSQQQPDINTNLAAPTTQAPNISLTPPVSARPSRSNSPMRPSRRAPSSQRLAPPNTTQHVPQSSEQSLNPSLLGSPAIAARSASPSSRPFPKLPIPTTKRSGSPTLSPFPSFSIPPSPTHSFGLPPPSVDPDTFFNPDPFLDVTYGQDKPLKWWPYRLLPPPGVLVATLFPTLYTWREKNLWEKFLGVIAAPSVFLLTITLPVVETGREDEAEEDADPVPKLHEPSSRHQRSKSHSTTGGITIIEPASPSPPERYRDDPELVNANGTQHPTTDSTSYFHQNLHHAQPVISSPTDPNILQSPEEIPVTQDAAASPKNWNRWLVILQSFTAPLFIVVIFWANTSPESPRALVKPILISSVVSLVLLLLLLVTTTPEHPPKWRFLLSFAGFVVAISWISTIANEVVGVLKTIGVVLDMSDAILGLTIFAVGNSLGDLVADITVARLGFPVMALSACFGGPMLNILLGIGLSGLYMTIAGANKRHHKHPDRPMKFKPYPIEVSRTLMVSGATLLVTLVGLLLAVPARKWRMDKMIGWGLVSLWVASTIGNIIGEVLGWGAGRIS